MHLDTATRTHVEVNEKKSGHARIWNGKNWSYIKDNRGGTQYSISDKSESEIDYLGSIAKGFTLSKPEKYQSWIKDKWQNDDAKYLNECKNCQRETINESRTDAELGGFEFNGAIFDSDRDSIQRIANAALAAQSALAIGQDFNVNWTIKDNSTVELDAKGMLAVQLAMVAHVNTTHEKARDLKDQIDAAKTIADVVKIQWPDQAI